MTKSGRGKKPDDCKIKEQRKLDGESPIRPSHPAVVTPSGGPTTADCVRSSRPDLCPATNIQGWLNIPIPSPPGPSPILFPPFRVGSTGVEEKQKEEVVLSFSRPRIGPRPVITFSGRRLDDVHVVVFPSLFPMRPVLLEEREVLGRLELPQS